MACRARPCPRMRDTRRLPQQTGERRKAKRRSASLLLALRAIQSQKHPASAPGPTCHAVGDAPTTRQTKQRARSRAHVVTRAKSRNPASSVACPEQRRQQTTLDYIHVTFPFVHCLGHEPQGFGHRPVPRHLAVFGRLRLSPLAAGLPLLQTQEESAQAERALRRPAGGHRPAAAVQRNVCRGTAARFGGGHSLPA